MKNASGISQKSVDGQTFRWKIYSLSTDHLALDPDTIRTREVIAIEKFQRHCLLIYEIFFKNYRTSIKKLNEILQTRNASSILVHGGKI